MNNAVISCGAALFVAPAQGHIPDEHVIGDTSGNMACQFSYTHGGLIVWYIIHT